VEDTPDSYNMATQQPNPLTRYMRQPVIYIKLPSNGQFWPAGALDMPLNGELPVLSLSTRDEIVLNTPDALMNGQGVVDVIQSCCPNIKNAWAIPSVDVDTILIAMRIASYGEQMSYNSKCPSCEEDNEYEIDLREWLGAGVEISGFQEPFKFKDLLIHIKPNDYKSMNDGNMEQFEQQRLVQTVNDSSLSEQEKQNRFNDIFSIMTQYTIRSIAGSISKIVTPEGSEVSDAGTILDFVENAERGLYDSVKKQVEQAISKIPNKVVPTTCPECQHAYETPFTFDQSNFFAFASSV
jgi:hypothetical protein